MSLATTEINNTRPETGSAEPRIAVTIPCYNEAATIAKVIEDFRKSLPTAEIYVYDNNSSDGTAQIAADAGAIVRTEHRQGKGHVVRRIFSDIEADLYVMADGDDTYDASMAPQLVELLKKNHVDMVVGIRDGVTKDAGREGHAFGNKLFNKLYGKLFGNQFSDIFSGYRIFTRRFVKSFPAVSAGFEIETEMSVHCSQLGIPTLERPTKYGVRPEDSTSKLRTFHDGFRILGMFAMLAKETRPAAFFGLIGVAMALGAMLLATPLVFTYAQTGMVPRLPTAVLSMGMVLIGTVTAVCGLILDSLARARLEAKRAVFLSYKSQPWR